MKKLISVLLAAAIICCIIPVYDGGQLAVSANAASIEMNIKLLRSKFPDGKFWNHKTNANHNHIGVYGTCRNPACNNPDGYTSSPCSTHNGVVGIGGYDCNNFDDAIQCMGFAMKLFYDIHGVTARNVAQRYDIQNVGVGDYIRMLDDSHSAVVIARNGNNITVAECNLYGTGNQCKIRWDYTYNINTINYFCHSDAVGTSLHQCTYGSNYICAECGAFNPASVTASAVNLTFSIKNNDAVDHTGPYGACAVVNSYKKGEVVTAVEKLINAHGHTWYKLSNGKYIYDEYLKAYTINYKDINAGDYRILNFSTMKYLIVDGGINAERQNVSVWDYAAGATEEKWAVTKDNLGYIITTKLGSRVLNPYADVISAGNNVNILTAKAGDTTQRWRLELVTGGYVIRNVANLSCVLTVKDGHNVILDTYRVGDLTQVWQFETAADCSHNWSSSSVTQKPTCSSTGVMSFTCSICSGVKHEIIPENDVHLYDDGVVTKKGTCKTEGEILYSCLTCEKTYTEKTGYGSIHANLQCGRSGAYDSVSQMTCKSCGATYTYDLGVRALTVTPLNKNEIQVKIEFADNRNVIKSDNLSYQATAVSDIKPNGFFYAGSGPEVKSHSVSGNVYTGIIEFSDAALKNLVGDKHSFFIQFQNKDEPSNKYGYVKVIVDWKQGSYKYVKPGESFDVQELLGVKLGGYYLEKYDTAVAEYKDGKVTAKAPGCAYFVFCSGMTGEVKGFTVVVEDVNKPSTDTPVVPDTPDIPQPSVIITGDVDGDNKISSSDARLALRCAVGLDSLDASQFAAADVDKDNKVSSGDARYILRFSVGLIDSVWI